METDGDPAQAIRRLSRPELPRRFYKSADAVRAEGGFTIALDGRPVRTPAKNTLLVPADALAQALAEEWAAQTDVIDPVKMPLTRLANSTIDGVAREPEPVRAEIVKYAGSDLLCYRAKEPERLVAKQSAAWDPILDWAGEMLGARFVTARGISFVAQPQAALDALVPRLEKLDVFRLAAANAVTTLTGSALLALALFEKRLSPEEVWTAAHVDEDWNVELWGADEEAMDRRARRYAEMQAAARVIALLS